MRIRSLNHSTYKLQYHVVWGTKYRRKWLKEYVKHDFLEILYEIVKKYPSLWIENINVDNDHVHMQIEIPPNVAISDAIQKLKAGSSLFLRKKFKFIDKMYIDKDGIWSVGYFVSSVGLNESQIRKYIDNQSIKDIPQTTTLFN